ncbi:MAG: hypothetical protein ABI761_18790 [Saprospiraceae bacterium]
MEQNQKNKGNQHPTHQPNQQTQDDKWKETNSNNPGLNRKSSDSKSDHQQSRDNRSGQNSQQGNQHQDHKSPQNGKFGNQQSQEHSTYQENTGIEMRDTDDTDVENPEEDDLENRDQDELSEEHVTEHSNTSRNKKSGGYSASRERDKE